MRKMRNSIQTAHWYKNGKISSEMALQTLYVRTRAGSKLSRRSARNVAVPEKNCAFGAKASHRLGTNCAAP